MGLSVLVVGGAGYIGSHMVRSLGEKGHKPVTLDNLSTGHRDAVLFGDFIHANILTKGDMKKLFKKNSFDAVMHLAALCYVGESMRNPQEYYRNNVEGTLNLLDAMLDAGLDKIIFSSSCAVYGIPDNIPITEGHPQNPINPYGRTKRAVEDILGDYAFAYGMNSISLRYFNAAGCDPDGVLGERHDPETHLIPLILREALRIQRGGRPEDTSLEVFGEDFDTPDGTCIRDYIHIRDLCAAHMLALQFLMDDSAHGADAYNLGNGNGFSVREVIEACRRVTGIDIQYRIAERRAGDPPRLVGSSKKARAILGWEPKFKNLDAIIKTAWDWFGRQTSAEMDRPR
jgi:UDP-glucose 4-epimerase